MPTQRPTHKDLARFYLRRRRHHKSGQAQLEAAFTRAVASCLEPLGPHATLAAFLPLGGEPPIRPALDACWEQGVRVLVPRTLPQGQLEWVDYQPKAPLVRNRLGILEPQGPAVDPQAFWAASLRLIPALALDLQGTRLGQGGGYYDRLLSQSGSAPLDRTSLAVVFEDEILDGLPADPWEARFEYALTEQGVRQLAPRG